MTKYRNRLPQSDGGLYLTDSGLETFLCFQRGIELPEFASFPLLDTAQGRTEMTAYFERHIRIAEAADAGFILETPTWRASADWGVKLGYDLEALRQVNADAVEFLADLRERFETPAMPVVISGNIGPKGDGYNPEELLRPGEAQAYHTDQVRAFAEAGADLITALTITHVGEAIGIVRAARDANMPVVISFTTETDGRLPEGGTLADAVRAVDVMTKGYAAYFMVNCAHPTHFQYALEDGSEWVTRVRGIRANASRCSHEELDNAEVLDEGNPEELGAQYRNLRRRFPHFTVLGGCCGTDHRHIESISDACKLAA